MKELLRQKLIIKRKYFQNVRREVADEQIAFNFLEGYGGLDSFFVYNSFGSETGTALIIDRLLKADKRVYLPRVEGDKMVVVPYGRTVKGTFGIEEPLGEPYTGRVDVTVTPLLAVNGRGFRVGYGKGYYDRFFKENQTLRVGLGYDFQREEFPEDEWDERLDALITERGIYYFGNTRD